MTVKKIKNMSVAADLEFKNKVIGCAKKLGKTTSEYIRDVVEKHMQLLDSEDEFTPIIVKIPNNVKNDKQQLEKWLSERVQVIINTLESQD
jgi:predicted DNA-binding protein